MMRPTAENRTRLIVKEDAAETNLGLLEPETPDTGEALTFTVDQVPLASQVDDARLPKKSLWTRTTGTNLGKLLSQQYS